MSFINMNNTTPPPPLLLLIGLLSLLLLRRLFFSRRTSKSPPIAGGGWPIIGHLPLLTGPTLPHKTLGALADKYGPSFTISLGSQRALIISNSETAKECFTTNDLALSSRPNLIPMQRLGYNGAMFGFAPYGPYWLELRKMATLHLLSSRRIHQLSHVRVSELRSCIKRLFKAWLPERSVIGPGPGPGPEWVLVDLGEWFWELAMNMVVRSVCGKRCFGGEVEEEEGRRFLECLKEWVHLMGVFMVGDAIPFLRWLDLGGYEKKMKKVSKEIDCVLDEWLEEHRRKRISGGEGDQDFIHLMLSSLEGSNLGGYDADTIIKATTLTLIVGGVDTTSVTLTWAMCRLLNNPRVLEEAQKELDTQVGKETSVKESDIQNLTYLQAIVKETLRLHPPASLSGPREFTEDCIINGCHVTKGTQLITNLWKIQTDPTIWSDPLEFKPERFLTTHKDVDIMRGKHFELIPFGSGRRICAGISFGLQAIHLSLATFLHCFEFSKKASDEAIDMGEVFGLTTNKATPLELLIKPRLSTEFYDGL
ncbi:cytochrome P450 82A3-like isoform X1 [Senna tora]|uniref:Cytochrome P450 82A3-like isoform X1 n=1 Tax=Senna tora TaxID=362788 RepID=A0A834WSQ8_9FABA|nr:cytochrome P450 82A3-like isoform X1 [Senna tora]